MRRLMWIGLICWATQLSTAQNQDHEEKRSRFSDGTRDVVELVGGKSQRYIEHLLNHNKEIQKAADLLRQKGYTPLEAYTVYTERTGRGTPKDHMEGEAIWWRWEDYDENLATGIVYARHWESNNTEIMVVQLDSNTGEEQWHWTARRSGKGKRSEAFAGPSQVLPAKFRQEYEKSFQLIQRTECYSWECAAAYQSYYACAAWGCGAAAVVGFLLGPIAGPPAFFGTCTGAMIGCLRQLF